MRRLYYSFSCSFTSCMRSWSSHSGLYSFFPLGATLSFWYNIMIKVNQHALINLVYSYMVTKVFNIQPVLFHQCYLCHLLWFKKQSFTYFENQILRCLVCCVHLRAHADAVSIGSYPRSARAKIASLHVISEIWLLLQYAVALQRADADLHKCDHVNFFLLGGGVVVRLTAKPRYLLLLHRGKDKSNTVTALVLMHLTNQKLC